MEDRVRDELLPHEAEAVLSIPLSKRRPEDSLIWQKTKNGVYTARSAYRMLPEIEALSKPGQSNPAANNGFGRKYGASMSLTKLNIFYGGLVAKHYLQRRICASEKSPMMCVKAVVRK